MMAQARVLPFRILSLRLSDRKLLFSRPCRQYRLCAALSDTRHRSLTPLAVSGLDQELNIEPEFGPVYTDSIAYSFVHALPEDPSPLESEALKPIPKNVESIADDSSLANPLKRMERMGTGWFGAILDFEGVVIQQALATHVKAWIQLAEEASIPRPLQSILLRVAPMKAEQAISEVLCWGREPQHVQKLARRKEEIFQELSNEVAPAARDGLYRFLETLKQHNIPIAVCSTESQMVFEAMQSMGLWQYVDIVVSAEDVGRCAPDPEAYAFAAQQLERPPFRCVVFGISNQSCEAAHDCGMKYVAAAGNQPLYELNAADLVIKQLDELTIHNLKQLFRHEEFIESPEMDGNGLELAPETQSLP